MAAVRRKAREYAHRGSVEVRSIAGSYCIEKEKLISVNGRDGLFEIGNGLVDSSCCGVGGCRFAHVAGFVHRDRMKQDEKGRWVSEVEPIQDPNVRKKLEAFLIEEEMVQQILWESHVSQAREKGGL